MPRFSVRRDRSALLVGEPGGRIGRVDLALLAVVFLAALGLRTYRLEQPFSMHFDEVYHARTAMEFLQDWRYGMPHSIYEFTHPHLAKYAMALGIEALGNNRVVSTTDLGAPVTAAAIEVRWSPPDAPNEYDGDRLYVATGSEVRVYDLAQPGPALVATIAGSWTSVAVDASRPHPVPRRGRRQPEPAADRRPRRASLRPAPAVVGAVRRRAVSARSPI